MADVKNGGELAVKDQNTDLALADDFLDEALGNSFEDFSQGDLLVPYVRIMQALSKELQKGHAKYIKGSEAGQFINSATKRIWDGEKGFYAIPIHYSHRYQAWRPNNGGPANDYGSDDTVYKSIAPNEKGKRINNEGNEVTDSNQYFVLLVDPETGDTEMGVFSMSGSQSKKARGWNSLISNRREKKKMPDGSLKTVSPAMYYYSYHITSVPESNDQGQWYGFSISEGPKVPELPNAKEIFELAKTTRERITSGELKAATEEHEETLGEGEEEKAF